MNTSLGGPRVPAGPPSVQARGTRTVLLVAATVGLLLECGSLAACSSSQQRRFGNAMGSVLDSLGDCDDDPYAGKSDGKAFYLWGKH